MLDSINLYPQLKFEIQYIKFKLIYEIVSWRSKLIESTKDEIKDLEIKLIEHI